MVNTKFLGLQIDNHLNWRKRIEQAIRKYSITVVNGPYKSYKPQINLLCILSLL